MKVYTRGNIYVYSIYICSSTNITLCNVALVRHVHVESNSQ